MLQNSCKISMQSDSRSSQGLNTRSPWSSCRVSLSFFIYSLSLTYLEGLSKTSVKNVLWIPTDPRAASWQSMDLGPNWWCKLFKASHSIRIILPHHDWKRNTCIYISDPRSRGRSRLIACHDRNFVHSYQGQGVTSTPSTMP